MEIYTDGSSLGNPGRGGYGAVIVYKNKAYEIIGSEDKTTNNRMELSGAIFGIKFANSLSATEKIIVHTDSTYLQKGVMLWMHGWIKNGWKTKEGKDVLNKDLWEKLNELTARNMITFAKVEGHSGHLYNERADTLATAASSGKNEKLYEGKDLKEYIIEIETMLKDKKTKPKGKKGEKAYGYISMIGKDIVFHKEWNDCKKMVEGKKARFQKVFSEQEKNDLVGRWTMENMF